MALNRRQLASSQGSRPSWPRLPHAWVSGGRVFRASRSRVNYLPSILQSGELTDNALAVTAITDCRWDDYRSDGSSVARPPFNVIREYHFGACRAQRHQVGYSHAERSSWPSFERWPKVFNTFEPSDHTHSIAYSCRSEKGRRLVFRVVGLARILADLPRTYHIRYKPLVRTFLVPKACAVPTSL
ncbi:hypothetical protein Taro_039208 [Colocasia esculenta]|uniref:Uncharacterized protein n=1 Tax=Colocasia esculenta TaxID=4460 RepID=A0A843WI71_COLES|nr:hypothetical protein [Colocasia esculenta]